MFMKTTSVVLVDDQLRRVLLVFLSRAGVSPGLRVRAILKDAKQRLIIHE